MELLVRFLVGGLVVSLFAVLGDVLKPKSFAGIFSAAPSIAIATLGMTALAKGNAYAALEARSMTVGAIGFFVYACGCARIMAKHGVHAATAAIAGLSLWLGVALAGWLLLLR